MIQRRHATPPRQDVIPIKVRLNQPYHRRNSRPIRRGEKGAPSLRLNQFCKSECSIDRSSFILCPKVHSRFHPRLSNQGRRKRPRAKEAEKLWDTPAKPAAPSTRPIILHYAGCLNATRSHRTTTLTSRRNHQVLLELAIRFLIHRHPHLPVRKTHIEHPERHPSALLFRHLFKARRHPQRLQTASKIL